MVKLVLQHWPQEIQFKSKFCHMPPVCPWASHGDSAPQRFFSWSWTPSIPSGNLGISLGLKSLSLKKDLVVPPCLEDLYIKDGCELQHYDNRDCLSTTLTSFFLLQISL